MKLEVEKIGKDTQSNEICVPLTKKQKKNCYRNLNEKNITYNKNFWKAVKPVLSNKSVSNEKIILDNSYDWQRDSKNFK